MNWGEMPPEGFTQALDLAKDGELRAAVSWASALRLMVRP